MNKNRIEIYDKNNRVEKELGLDGLSYTLNSLDSTQDFSYIEDFDKHEDTGKIIRYNLKEHFLYGLSASALDQRNTNELIKFFDTFDDLGFKCRYNDKLKSLVYETTYDTKSFTKVYVYSITYTDDSSFQSMIIKYKVFNSYFGFIGDMRGSDNSILVRLEEATKSIRLLIDDLVVYDNMLSDSMSLNGYKIICNPNERKVYCKSKDLTNFEIEYFVSKAECGGVLYKLSYVDTLHNNKIKVIDTLTNDTILNFIYGINSMGKKVIIKNSNNCIDCNTIMMSNDMKDIISLLMQFGCSIDFNDITDSFIANKLNKKLIIISKIDGSLHDKTASILLMDTDTHNTSIVYNRRVRYPSTKKAIINFLNSSF